MDHEYGLSYTWAKAMRTDEDERKYKVCLQDDTRVVMRSDSVFADNQPRQYGAHITSCHPRMIEIEMSQKLWNSAQD
jgi:hypothetical protein